MKEMTEYLTKILDTKVKNLYELTSKIKSLEQATKVLDYLTVQITVVDEEDNPHFCHIGGRMLKEAYNELYDRWPKLTKYTKNIR